MKKITSLLLTLCLIISAFNMCALANGGYGDSFGSVEDNLPNIIERNFDIEYAVAYNDFENVNGYAGASGYVIENTGNSAYGNALKVPASGWATPGSTIYNSTYSWNGTTYKVFNEPIVEGENYIFSFEYWSDPDPKPVIINGKEYKPTLLNGSDAFTLCPQHDQFWIGEPQPNGIWSGNDHRNNVKYYSDNNWHLDSFSFTAKSSTIKYINGGKEYTFTGKSNVTNTKLNTGATYMTSYVDNYLIMKAGVIEIDDPSNSISFEAVQGDFIMANSDKAYNDKTTVALGSNIKFKFNSTNIGVSVDEVKMGDTTLTPDSDGVYSVKIIDDIAVTVKTNTSIVTDKYVTDTDGNIYFEDSLTTYNFTDSFGAPSTLINTTRGGKEERKDVYLTVNDKLSYSVGNVTYNVKYIGDVAGGGDGKWTVSDVVSTVEYLLDMEDTPLNKVAYDINKSNRVTVSDVVALRSKILNMPKAVTADPQLVAKMTEQFKDVLTRSGTGATEQDLINGIYNYGDRTRIANVIRKAMRGEQIKVVYFGGSITNTSGGSSNAPFTNSITETGGYVQWITSWFEKNFGKGSIDAFNAGIGSTDTPLAIHRMVEDVLERKPDLVINEWSMNDGPTIEYKRGTYEAVLKRLLENDIAVLLYGFAGSTGHSAENVHKPFADYYNTPFISENMAFSHLSTFPNFTNDDVHPNMVGHALTGTNMTYFLQKVYEDIANIGTVEVSMPSEYSHHEAHYYEGAYMADLYDIYNGEFDGIRIKDMGSFSFETTKTSFGIGGYRSYYGATAKYSESYEPMVIEIDSCKTMFILTKVSNGFNDGAYYIELNGEKMTNSEFNCSKGKKADKNPESGYHWPSPRILADMSSPKVELKIYPNITEDDRSAQYPDGNNRVTIFSLLLS